MISDKELPVFDSYIAVVLHEVTNICTRCRNASVCVSETQLCI